jgi:uncharacterized cupredoxin-like copper-binding protein
MKGPRLAALAITLTLAGIAMLGAGAVLATGPGSATAPGSAGRSMMGGSGMTGGTWTGPSSARGPGEAGFVAGTAATPRIVRVIATPQLRFLPDAVTVAAGETITFEVTAMGPIVHEFMVGPAADVAADQAGTPEIADIGMMQTKSLTYTFTGSGPFAFACHAPGHYEAGMTGTVVVQ